MPWSGQERGGLGGFLCKLLQTTSGRLAVGAGGGVTSREGAHPQQSSGGVNLLQHGQENESGTERHSAGFALKRPVSQADVPRVGTSLPPLL